MEGLQKTRTEFLGGFRIFDDTGEELLFPVVKGAAIIAYLSVHAGNRATRGELTGLLWGDKPESAARTALRQCLHQMRSKLKALEPAILSISPHAISLERDKVGADIDVLLDPGVNLLYVQPGDLDPYQFLLGFEDLDPAFSDWLWNIRTQLDERFRAKLKSIITNPQATPDQKLWAARHLNFLDPSQEAAARLLIEQSAREGDLVSLLRVYQKLWDALDEEWGEVPSTELQDFVGRTRARFEEIPNSTSGAQSTAPYRKYLTVLALSVHSNVVQSGESEPCLKLATEAILIRGGIILQSGTGSLCCGFGLQNHAEDSARDGIEAALELRDLLGGAEGFGVGLDTGFLLIEPSPSSEHQPKISGSVIASAQAHATCTNEFPITVTARTMHGLEGYYQTVQAQTQSDASQPPVRLTGRNAGATQDGIHGQRRTFVGRGPFLAALWKIWTDALETGSIQIASVQGPAGVGKTRLADEFRRRLSAEGTRALRSECNRYDRSAPLEPLIELLRTLDSDAEHENQASGNQQLPRSSSKRRHRTEEIVSELKSVLCGSPAMIFIDDWQWADDATRLALGKFVASTAGSALLLVLTSRNAPADEWLVANSHQIVLPNLTAREVVERAELLLNRPIDGRLKTQILAKSGGNPLLLEEVCHALRHSSLAQQEGAIAELPANVQALFASRFETLEADELEVVFAASTHGDLIDPKLLSDTIGHPVDPTVFDRLARHDVLTMHPGSPHVRFKHGLARDVAYNMIPEERRRALHRAYADCLRAGSSPEEEESVAERLAFHYRGAGDVTNASRFAEISGDKALKSSALDQAIWHYGIALDLAEQLPMDAVEQQRWVSLAVRWAIPTTYAPSYEQLPILERAEALAKQIGDLRSAATLRYWIGYFAYVLGEKDRPLKDLRKARDIADSVGDVRQSVEVDAIEGCILASVARYDKAEQMMRGAIALKDRHPGKHKRAPVTSVYTRANLALLRADRGDFAEADELIAEALHRVREFEHEVESSILLFSGTINIWRGAWQRAIEDAGRSRERSEKVSSLYLTGMSRCIWGYAHWRLNGGTTGLQTLAKNARWMRDRGMKLYFSFICGWLADAMAENGRYNEAEAAYQDALERAPIGEIAGAAMACRASARYAIAEGRFDDASRRLSAADTFAERREAAHEIAANHLMNARLAHATNKRDDAMSGITKAKLLLKELGLEHRLQLAREVEAELFPIG